VDERGFVIREVAAYSDPASVCVRRKGRVLNPENSRLQVSYLAKKRHLQTLFFALKQIMAALCHKRRHMPLKKLK